MDEYGTRGTLQMVFRLVGGGESSGFPMEFLIPIFREFQLEMSCAPCLINLVYLFLP